MLQPQGLDGGVELRVPLGKTRRGRRRPGLIATVPAHGLLVAPLARDWAADWESLQESGARAYIFPRLKIPPRGSAEDATGFLEGKMACSTFTRVLGRLLQPYWALPTGLPGGMSRQKPTVRSSRRALPAGGGLLGFPERLDNALGNWADNSIHGLRKSVRPTTSAMHVRYGDARREHSFRAKQLVLDAYCNVAKHLGAEEATWEEFLTAAYDLKLVHGAPDGAVEPLGDALERCLL